MQCLALKQLTEPPQPAWRKSYRNPNKRFKGDKRIPVFATCCT